MRSSITRRRALATTAGVLPALGSGIKFDELADNPGNKWKTTLGLHKVTVA